jgi:serine/threonine-protein kinase
MVGDSARHSDSEHRDEYADDHDRPGASIMTAERSQASMSAADGVSAEFLQGRLAVFARVMFFAFVTLRLAEFLLYRVYSAIWPDHYWTIFAIGAGSVALLAIAWWVLSRFPLARSSAHTIDVLVMACCGMVFGTTAILASNRPESAYTCLFYACFVVFMRTIVVPSSGTRTVAISALAMLPLLVAALDLAVMTVQDVPGPAYFVGAAVFISGAVAVAATGSRVIYGLRRRISSLTRDDLELGQYTLVRKLGEGSTGAVFLARHALLRRPTAIKLVQPNRAELLARCERGVQQMSQLRHHNTVAVYDYGRSPDGVFYFAMELLEGLDLAALLETYGPQPTGRVVAVVIQLCGSLHEAHERGVVHGNIKPTNVILCERGGLYDVAKLTDFGFATPDATEVDDLRALQELAVTLVHDDAAPAIAQCFDNVSSAKQLAASLRGLAIQDWTVARAHAWWATHRTGVGLSPLKASKPLEVDVDRRVATS